MNKIKKNTMLNFLIGIDPGVKTGYAVYDLDKKSFNTVKTLSIIGAYEEIKRIRHLNNIYVMVEDARQRKWYGKTSKEVLQGVGSVKRDCKIWEEILKELKIKHKFIHPKKILTKSSKETFQKSTGITYRTSEHARDAAMMINGYDIKVLDSMLWD